MEENHKDKVNLTIVGCGDAFASDGRFNTCFYLNYSDEHVLVDCGASSLVGLKKQDIPLSKINTIVLSHLHGDHFGGLPFYILDAKHLQKRTEPLNILGPKGTEQKTKELTALLYPGTDLDSMDYKINFQEYESREKVNVGQLEIQAFPVIHSEESNPHGLRITMGNKIFAFSGDTEWTDVLLEISNDADLFICECNYYGFKGPNHLDYQTILANLDRMNFKRIILNHLGEEMLDKISELKLDCAYDGQLIDF